MKVEPKVVCSRQLRCHRELLWSRVFVRRVECHKKNQGRNPFFQSRRRPKSRQHPGQSGENIAARSLAEIPAMASILACPRTGLPYLTEYRPADAFSPHLVSQSPKTSSVDRNHFLPWWTAFRPSSSPKTSHRGRFAREWQ